MSCSAHRMIPVALCAVARQNSGFFWTYIVFNGHVLEFAGFKNIATFLALNKFGVLFASHDADTWMPAEFLHKGLFGRSILDW